MTESEMKFAARAIRRKKLFLPLSLASVVVGLGLAVFYTLQVAAQPGLNGGVRFVLVLLIFLNARQNLRQHHYVKILEKLVPGKGLATRL